MHLPTTRQATVPPPPRPGTLLTSSRGHPDPTWPVGAAGHGHPLMTRSRVRSNPTRSSVATAVTPASWHVICIRTSHQWLQHLLVPPGRHKRTAELEVLWRRGHRPGRPHLRGRGDRGLLDQRYPARTGWAVLGRPDLTHRGGRGGAGPVGGPTWVRLRPGRCGRRLRGHRPRGFASLLDFAVAAEEHRLRVGWSGSDGSDGFDEDR